METTLLNNSKKRIDYKEIVRPYIKHWKWFTASLLVAISLAIIKIRYSTPEYAVQGKIQILEDQSAASELGAFSDLQIYTGANAQVEDEIEILNSRSNFIEVVKQLGLNVRILGQGTIYNTEIYKNPPVKVNFLIPDSLVFLSKHEFSIKILSDTSFSYIDLIEEDPQEKIYSFGNTISSNMGDFVLIPKATDMTSLIEKQFIISINPLVTVAQAYQEKLQISVTNEFSNIVSIQLQDPDITKAKEIVDALVDNYNNVAIQDKKLIADKTSEFINERITDIYGDLSSVEKSAEQFKSGRGITDVASQSSTNFTIGAQSRQELQNANIQLNIAASMKDIVESQQGYEVLPSNVGLSDASITNTTARYNDLVLERNRLLKSSNEKNPIIVNLDQQLNGLKKNLESSLNSMTNNLNLQANNLSNQLSQINARIYAAPGNERALREITRQQQTTEGLYLYLLQKREESQITFASASPKSKVIDRAYPVSEFPVAPKKSIILMAALILGALVPFSVIYVNQLLDNKVRNKVTLEKFVGSVPVLAELPKLSKKEKKLVKTEERTVLAEALRILRTNLDYVIKFKKTTSGKGNVILVTSSVPGEGKTLISANLAMIFAKANKKVLLIGADIRNPKIFQFYSGKNVDRLGKLSGDQLSLGLTEFLVDRNIEISDIISPMLAHDQVVDVIYSGKVPPNPAELLMSDRMKELMQAVPTEYDYVIVDTAPLMVVTDTLLISEYADQILYVTRADVTELKVLEFPLKMHREGKLNGLAFIVNGVKDSNLGYGGSYGYGYGQNKKKWWKFA